MSIVQLNPPLNVRTTLGPALALLLEVDDWDVLWCCAQKETGEIWWWSNEFIRLDTTITSSRGKPTEITLPPNVEAALTKHRQRYRRQSK